MRGRLTDAAKGQAKVAREKATEQVVKYIGKGSAAAALTGLIGGGGGAGGAAAEGDENAKKAQADLERKREEEARGREKDRLGKRGKKLDEVDVTGYELERVLACETGHKRTDKHLDQAFKKLGMKMSKGLETRKNPVLRVVGGPELEERGRKSFLVFYPFSVEHVEGVEVVREHAPQALSSSQSLDGRVHGS